MAYPQEYIEYLVHFHGSRDYFECHEVLEEYWKKTGRKDSVWIGFIQLAVSQYHHRRGNFTGAYRTLQKSLQIFLSQPAVITRFGIDVTALIAELQALLCKIEQSQGYESINLPLASQNLIDLCLKRSRELNMKWGSQSLLSDTALVHRHKTRDRSQVIRERNEALQEKHKRLAQQRTCTGCADIDVRDRTSR